MIKNILLQISASVNMEDIAVEGISQLGVKVKFKQV